MSVISAIAQLLTGGGEYLISRSVRLRSSATAYFNRTFASAGNQQKFTYSIWAKRGGLGSKALASSGWSGGGASQGGAEIAFAGDSIQIDQQTNNANDWIVKTTAVYRDPSAWYHIVVAVDTTQATAANRVIVYVNGVQVTSYATASYPSQNLNTKFNATNQRLFASDDTGNPYIPFDGYAAECRFIDGQALTASSFGEFDAVTGVWKPKKYTGTYGTNGWYLDFSDNSAATAAAIGKDSSGNGNNWTPNNISVTAGVTYDSMLDVPTPYADGGNGRGNYAVLNPLDAQPALSITNGNLATTYAAGAYTASGRGTVAVSSGKWYWETTLSTLGSGAVGVTGIDYTLAQIATNAAYNSATTYAFYNGGTTPFKLNSGTQTSYGSTVAAGDVIGVALDLDGGSITFYKNGSTMGSAFTGISGTFAPLDMAYSGAVHATNFGQRPFAYTPPTGFKALNTQNLPDSTIKKGNAYFDASLYTGNAGSITVTNAGFQPDLVWVKARSSAYDHKLVDSVRGSSGGIYYELDSNLTSAESLPGSGVNGLTATGFTIGTGANNGYNGNGTTFVGWQWKANGSAVSNTAGSITAQVNAGVNQGFSIATFTTPASFTNATVGHGLGVAPSMIITRRRTTSDWITWHKSLGTSGYLTLNTTSAFGSNSGAFNGTSSTTWTMGSNTWWQASASDYIAYVFAEVAGFSKFGSYTGNGSADGAFVYCGFRPRYVMMKLTSSAGGDWCIVDTARDTYNASLNTLIADGSSAEFQGGAAASAYLDILSNGFKLRTTNGGTNGSGSTYIFAAFAENPFKNSLAR